MKRYCRQKIHKETEELSCTLGKLDIINLWWAFLPTTEYSCFSTAHRMFSMMDPRVVHHISLNKLTKVEIILSIFSDHSTIKLEIRKKENAINYTKKWKLSNLLLNNQWIKEEMKNISETKENGNTTYQNIWDARREVLWGMFIVINSCIEKTDFK